MLSSDVKETMPKPNIDEILAAIPARPPRSRLEPYRELIEELRRRRVTFREIAEILAEQCNIRVSRAAVHDFLKTRARPVNQPARTRQGTRAAPSQSIESRPPSAVAREDAFEYDATQPLSLLKK